MVGAVCQRFRSTYCSDKLWSPRVTAMRRLLRGHSVPLPPRTSEPQWQQHNALVMLVAERAMRRSTWGDVAAAVLANDVQLLEMLLHLGFARAVPLDTRVHMLHNAVRGDHVEAATLLLQRAGGVALLGGLSSDAGRTALHYVRSERMVHGLLAFGADADVVDAHGMCPAETADAMGLDHVATLLRGQQRRRRR